MKQRINLHIDRLVLRGFNHEDRQGIAEGLQQELARMFADPQAAQQLTASGDMPQLRIGNISIGHGAKPQYIGVQLARGIERGTKR